MRLRSTLAAIAALALLATPVIAAGPFAQVDTGSTSVNFTPAVSGFAMTLTVTGPEGFRYEQTYDAGQAASFSIFDAAGDFAPGGTYTWELRAVPALSDSERAAMDELRATGADTVSLKKAGKLPQSFEPMSGTFSIEQGAIVTGGETEASPGGGNRLATKAQVFSTDLIVQGSACVGIDCTTSESFGFDTLRLKENNLRIRYQDTSNSGSFPTADWELRANDSSNGGENYWAVIDIDAGSQIPFKVEQGAGNNALVVNSNGNIGIDTVDPAVKLHMVDGNTPTLRLQQDGSAGFAAQIYDIGANEANFFVRDVTNGSRLAFRMKPGAPENSLYVAANGDVGLGTQNPSSELHVFQNADENKFITVENNHTGASAASVVKVDTDTSGINFTAHGSGRTITRFGETLGSWNELLSFSGNGLIIGASNANSRIILGTEGINVLEIDANQEVLYKGTAVHADYVFESDYEMPSIDEQAAYMWSNKHLPAIGAAQYAEDGREVMKIGSDRQGIVEELEKAHVFIAQLNDELKEKDGRVNELEERLQKLEALLSEQ